MAADREILEDVICRIKNWFVVERLHGSFTATGGSVSPTIGLADSQYFWVKGSVLNDGLHQHATGGDGLVDETWRGEIWLMAVPSALLSTVEEIQAWMEKNPITGAGLKSESFAGYSYQRDTAADGSSVQWQDVFSKRLRRWRKL